jgi:hypothetical protein
VARDYQEKGDYVTLDNLRSALSAVDSTYQKIGDYAYNSAVASALITL